MSGYGYGKGVGPGGRAAIAFTGFPASFSDIGFRVDDVEMSGSNIVTLYDVSGGGNDAIAGGSGTNQFVGTYTLDGYDSIECVGTAGFDLTSSINIPQEFDMSVVWYPRTVSSDRLFCDSAAETTYLFARESYWRCNLGGVSTTLWNSPPGNVNQHLRVWRDSSDNIRVSINGGADSTPGDKFKTHTDTLDMLSPYSVYNNGGGLYEVFMKLGANWTAEELTAMYTYIDTKYPTLGVTIP